MARSLQCTGFRQRRGARRRRRRARRLGRRGGGRGDGLGDGSDRSLLGDGGGAEDRCAVGGCGDGGGRLLLPLGGGGGGLGDGRGESGGRWISGSLGTTTGDCVVGGRGGFRCSSATADGGNEVDCVSGRKDSCTRTAAFCDCSRVFVGGAGGASVGGNARPASRSTDAGGAEKARFAGMLYGAVSASRSTESTCSGRDWSCDGINFAPCTACGEEDTGEGSHQGLRTHRPSIHCDALLSHTIWAEPCSFVHRQNSLFAPAALTLILNQPGSQLKPNPCPESVPKPPSTRLQLLQHRGLGALQVRLWHPRPTPSRPAMIPAAGAAPRRPSRRPPSYGHERHDNLSMRVSLNLCHVAAQVSALFWKLCALRCDENELVNRVDQHWCSNLRQQQHLSNSWRTPPGSPRGSGQQTSRHKPQPPARTCWWAGHAGPAPRSSGRPAACVTEGEQCQQTVTALQNKCAPLRLPKRN